MLSSHGSVRAKVIIVTLIIGMVWSSEQEKNKSDSGISTPSALTSEQGEQK